MEYHLGDLEPVKVCDFCNGTDFEQELVMNNWSLSRCKFCGLVFTSPRYTEQRLGNIYENNYYEGALAYLSMQAAEPSEDEYLLARKLMKTCSKEIWGRRLRMLDVGCGAGRLTKAFEKCGWSAVGIELSKKAVDTGRYRGLDLRVGDLRDCSLGDFDLLTAFHVIEHVHSPKFFFQQCRERLVDNGFLLIEVPDYGSHRSLKMGENWPYLYPDKHLYQFTIKSILGYLNQGKFSSVWVRKVHGRGPLENFNHAAESMLEVGKEIKGCLFAMRRAFYWSRGCRRLLRYLIWHVLGYGECIRVLAKKMN
jgi:SAM-dependent methyltransferase